MHTNFILKINFRHDIIFPGHYTISSFVVIVVVVHTKITRSQFLDVIVSDQRCHNVENGKEVTTLCSNVLDMDHKCYKLCFLVGHAYRQHLHYIIVMSHAASTVHAKIQCR